MCTFSTHSDFDVYHEEMGEICDYTAMKAEMLSGLTSSVEDHVNWFDLQDIDLDASWLDMGDIFEGLDDFISGIFESLD